MMAIPPTGKSMRDLLFREGAICSRPRTVKYDASMKPGGSEFSKHERSALAAGIAAFATWGLIPIYWKLLAAVPAPEILANRFVWTILF